MIGIGKMIKSRQNDLFKKYISLNQKKNIKKHNEYLVSGKNVVAELIEKNTDLLSIRTNEQSPISNTELIFSNELFQEIDQFGTHFPILCLPLPPIQPWDFSQKLKQHTLLLPTDKPDNLGAILRSACAFNISNIVLLAEACFPFLPKSIRASSGAFKHLKFYRGPSIHKIECSPLYAMDIHGEDIQHISIQQPSYFLFGEESKGIPAHSKAQRLTIPISQNIESLNVSAAAAILFAKLYNR